MVYILDACSLKISISNEKITGEERTSNSLRNSSETFLTKVLLNNCSSNLSVLLIHFNR